MHPYLLMCRNEEENYAFGLVQYVNPPLPIEKVLGIIQRIESSTKWESLDSVDEIKIPL